MFWAKTCRFEAIYAYIYIWHFGPYLLLMGNKGSGGCPNLDFRRLVEPGGPGLGARGFLLILLILFLVGFGWNQLDAQWLKDPRLW